AYDVARAVFWPGGTPVGEGDLLAQPDLAGTLKTLAEQGPDAFYTGDIAGAIVEAQLNARSTDDLGEPIGAADREKLRGRMTLEDLAAYRVAYRRPVSGSYRGLKIVSMPPPSSGGLTAIQILKLMERFPIGSQRHGFGFGSVRTLNVMIESMRLAFQDRGVWMGDDDFVDVPSRGLLDARYIRARSALIDPDSRQAEVGPDDPRPFERRGRKRRIRKSGLADDEGLNTTHFTVTDRHGNIVTYTSTIESAWGTGLMVPGYGFLLNNELTDFNRIPAANDDPDAFNPGANDAAPFKRPRSSMAPTMIFRGRTPIAAYGSPGGSSIINTVVNVTLNLVDHEKPVQEAVDAPRISFSSTSTTGGTTLYEQGIEDEVLQALTGLGHAFFRTSLGSVQAIVRDPRTGRQYGAADKRRIGSTISVRRKEIAPHRDRPNGGD
ncbi:MAG: gamma-glutamyltransferase family protein, partial [Gammaproteobacteria bacterium]